MSRPLHDYALLSDCHGAALVARDGGVDWCCLPRFDGGSCFGRLLDDERGGRIEVRGVEAADQRYLRDTLVVETTLRGPEGEARLLDALVLGDDGPAGAPHRVVRVVEGVRGRVELEVAISPRFDYGSVRPWLRRDADDHVWAIGGDDALAIWAQQGLRQDGEHDLVAPVAVGAGERARIALTARGAIAAQEREAPPSPAELDAQLEATAAWWRAFARRLSGTGDPATLRSALVLRALLYEPSGAILAAPTTSLPEAPGGCRNWDYRFSWVRDSAYAARTLAELGYDEEAHRFARFVLRSAAGHADELQVVFGVGGERRIGEQELDLAGYRGARPVRVGNEASTQLQLDALGELLGTSWAWHERGHAPDRDEWRFLRGVAATAARRWREPDRGIWEWRGEPLHFVHSKASCWAALDRGLRLARDLGDEVPEDEWRGAMDAIRRAIETDGWDGRRRAFRQAFGVDALDASVLLLPVTGVVGWDDERMASTADAIRDELGEGGLIRRHRTDDGLPGEEGTFLACSFWLAEVYARQGRHAEAREVYDAAMATASPLGLFAEEHDPERGEALGNYPQALTHLAQIAAGLALGG